jgi:hypothetical protein
VKIAHGVLPSEQSLCDLDKVVGALVVEVAGDPNGGRPCGSVDCQGIGHEFSWGSAAELFLSARADSAANSRRRQPGHSLRLLTQKFEGAENNVAAETPRAVRDVGGPGDKTAEQSLIVGVKARYEKVHNVGDVLGSTRIPRRRGSLVLVHLILIFGICG